MAVDESQTANPDPALVSLVTAVHAVTAAIAERFEVGDIHVDLVLADDFVSATQAILDMSKGDTDDAGAAAFQTERLGGEAVAKNLPLSDDSSHVAVVMNRALLAGTGDAAAHTIFLVAHELMHPVFERLRHQSGVLDGVVLPSSTPREIARSIARVISDEYRADWIASAILGQLVTIGPTGEETPLHAGDIFGDSYTQQFLTVLNNRVWPGWVEAVRSYQRHRSSLDTMWQRIVTDTDQTLTLLAHAQAVADVSGYEGPTKGNAATHQGVSALLGDVWDAFVTALEGRLFLGSPQEFSEADIAVSDALESALMSLWERLGLTFTFNEDRSFCIHVSDPQE